MPLVTLKRNAAAILGVEEDPVEAAVEKLAAAGKLVLQEAGDGEVRQVFLEELYHAERRIAVALRNSAFDAFFFARRENLRSME